MPRATGGSTCAPTEHDVFIKDQSVHPAVVPGGHANPPSGRGTAVPFEIQMKCHSLFSVWLEVTRTAVCVC